MTEDDVAQAKNDALSQRVVLRLFGVLFCFVSSAALCFYCSSAVCSCYCVTEVLVTQQHREKLLQQAASFFLVRV